MIRFIRRVLLLALAVVIVGLMVANRHSVPMGLDPFAADPPAIVLNAPMFVFLFAALLLGVLLGGIGAWAGQAKWRELARRRTREANRLRQDRERLARDLHSVQSGKEPAVVRLSAR